MSMSNNRRPAVEINPLCALTSFQKPEYLLLVGLNGHGTSPTSFSKRRSWSGEKVELLDKAEPALIISEAHVMETSDGSMSM